MKKLEQLTQDFYSYLRRNVRRTASYVTHVTTKKTDKKTSQLLKFFHEFS